MDKRNRYTPKIDSSDATAAILDVYASLPEGDPLKADIDALAAQLRTTFRGNGRPGLQGLGEAGAIELAGKLAMWAVLNNLELPDLRRLVDRTREAKLGARR